MSADNISDEISTVKFRSFDTCDICMKRAAPETWSVASTCERHTPTPKAKRKAIDIALRRLSADIANDKLRY